MRTNTSKKRPSAATRMLLKAAASMRGHAAGVVLVRGRMTGSMAEAWRDLRASAEGLGLDDTGLITLLLLHGGVAVRDALIDASKEAPE